VALRLRLPPILPLLLCLGMASMPIRAAPATIEHDTLTLDSIRSHADFEVKVLWLIGLHGDFGQVQGTLVIDRFRGQASVDARINASDVRMRSHNYETWARSAEFFDAQHYPQIHFVSESFPLVRLIKGGHIDGNLTLRGIRHRARFTLAEAACPDPLGGACPVQADGAIRRSDFGMHSRRGTLADKVELHLSIYVKPAATEPAP
jgi:polyisoprenoid-binding protein YceI